jgi:hypothetical protein
MAGYGLVVEMPMGELAACGLKGAEIGVGLDGGDARELLAEVVGVAAAVVGRMQQAVNVVEQIFFADATALARGGIGTLEMLQTRIRDRIATGVATFFRDALRKQFPVPRFFAFFVEVEGEMLNCSGALLNATNLLTHPTRKWNCRAYASCPKG